MNAMPDKNLGRSEAFLNFEIVGDHRAVGFQRKSSRGSEIRADAGDADNARLPTDPGPNQKPVFGRTIFEHLAKLGSQPLGGQTRRIRQKLVEPRSVQRADTNLREDFLLPNALL
jgi:hypothetical protein